MSGLSQLVPYTECQYPQVVQGNASQIEAAMAAAPVNSSGNQGLSDYIENFNWPIPQYLTPGNNRGLGCADCGGTCGGLGDVSMTCPGGFFSCGPGQWGIGEWASAAAGIYLITAAMPKIKTHAAKGKRAAAKGVSYLGTLTLIAAAGFGVYLWAQANAGTQ
jgi:hypothetical protein